MGATTFINGVYHVNIINANNAIRILDAKRRRLEQRRRSVKDKLRWDDRNGSELQDVRERHDRLLLKLKLHLHEAGYYDHWN